MVFNYLAAAGLAPQFHSNIRAHAAPRRVSNAMVSSGGWDALGGQAAHAAAGGRRGELAASS